MYQQSKSEAPQRLRDGLLSCILLQQGDVPDTQLSITWVEVAPVPPRSPINTLRSKFTSSSGDGGK
jgi:hypothetical protein